MLKEFEAKRGCNDKNTQLQFKSILNTGDFYALKTLRINLRSNPLDKTAR